MLVAGLTERDDWLGECDDSQGMNSNFREYDSEIVRNLGFKGHVDLGTVIYTLMEITVFLSKRGCWNTVARM